MTCKIIPLLVKGSYLRKREVRRMTMEGRAKKSLRSESKSLRSSSSR